MNTKAKKTQRRHVSTRAKKAKTRKPLLSPMAETPGPMEHVVSSVSAYKAKVEESYRKAKLSVPTWMESETFKAVGPSEEWAQALYKMARKDGILFRMFLADLWNEHGRYSWQYGVAHKWYHAVKQSLVSMSVSGRLGHFKSLLDRKCSICKEATKNPIVLCQKCYDTMESMTYKEADHENDKADEKI